MKRTKPKTIAIKLKSNNKKKEREKIKKIAMDMQEKTI